jgi:hypothetical protein
MTDRLKALGLMKGDTEAAVQAGAHALFLPHGLGHMMGMDVHDMEGLGQIHVGYDAETRPSSQFGTASLRFGRRLEEGFVVTDEPGIYFIKTGADFRIQPGTTLEQAVAALCEERGATYEMDIIGKFSKFTFDGATIVAEMQEQKDGTFVEISFKVTINGTEVKDYKDIALNHNDLVEIELVKGEAFTAS